VEAEQLDRLDELHDTRKTLMSALFQIVVVIHVLALGVPPNTIGTDEAVEVGVLVRVES
jgi:hypothetical protein